MKRIFVLTLTLLLVLSGCGSKTNPALEATMALQTQTPTPVPTEATTEAATEPTTEPTTEPAPVYYNPLNGTILEEPFTGRVYANTVANTPDALPHVGVNQADVVMEMFVNGSVDRCIAFFSDFASVEAIGSTRSTRLMFNDLVQHYSAIFTHAGGGSQCLRDAKERGIVNYNIDSLMRQGDPLMQGTAYRDSKRQSPHNLYGIGAGIMAYAESQDIPMTLEKDYGFRFTEDGTPAAGETAEDITIRLTYGKTWKDSTMRYDGETGQYTFWQYDKMMADYYTGEPEQYRNVVVMFADISLNGIYHQADFVAGGTGYYACGGKIVPMTWTCADEDSAFQFWTEDGEPLLFGQGRTYIAICSADSPVTYGAAEAEAE